MFISKIERLLHEMPEHLKPKKIRSGEISDGYHTFDELYNHRHLLFILLMRSHPKLSWRANNHEDGTMFSGMFIAGIDTPHGTITYHIPIKYWECLDYTGMATILNAPTWDGHTSEDVLKRCYDWVMTQQQDIKEEIQAEQERNK